MLFRLKNLFLCAPEDGTPPAGTGAATAADAVVAPVTQVAATPGTQDLAALIADAVGKAVGGLKSEIVDMRRETRNKFAAGTAPNSGAASAPSAPATAPNWDADAKLAFRDALEEAGVTATVQQRQILETLYQAERAGISNSVSWAKERAAAIGVRSSAAVAAAVQSTTPQVATPAVKAPDTGAPAGTTTGDSLPDDPSLLPQSVIDRMTPAEAKAHWERWKARSGQFVHPFKAARDSARGGGDLAAAAATIAAALQRK